MKQFTVISALMFVCTCVLADNLVITDTETVNIDSDQTYGAITFSHTSSWKSGKLNITDGEVTATGALTMGGSGNNGTTRLNLSGDAKLTVASASLLNSYATSNHKSYINLTNNAEMVISGNVSMHGNNGGMYQYFDIAGNSSFSVLGQLLMTAGSGVRETRMTIRDDATASFSNAYFGTPNGYAQNCFNLLVTNNATFKVPSGGTARFGNGAANGYDEAFAVFAGNSKGIIDGTMNIGSANAALGGSVVVKDNAKLIVGGTLQGGLSNAADGQLEVLDDAVVECTNSIVFWSGIRANEIFRMRLDGGTTRVKGFSKCTGYLSTAGQAYFTANGGTVAPMPGCTVVLQHFDLATLTGEGLTVDTEGIDTAIGQALTGTKFTKKGQGTLTANTASALDNVIVSGGTLKLGGGISSYGDAITVKDGAVLSTVGTSTGVNCDSLILGDGESAGILEMDAGDVITVADSTGLVVADGRIILSDPETLGKTAFLKVTTGTVAAGTLANFAVQNALVSREYEFTAEAGADGVTISVETKELVSSDATWTGASSSDWNTAANWSPAKVPTIASVVTLPADAAEKNISVSGGAAQKLIVEDDYSITGTGLASAGFELSQGKSTAITAPVTIPSSAPIALPEGSSLEFDGALAAASTVSVTPVGTGSLTIGGNNASFLGSWDFSAVTSTVVFASANAAGGSGASGSVINVGPGTLCFTGNVAQTVYQPLTLNPGTGNNISVFNAETDTALENGFRTTSGAFAKIGAGKLTSKYTSAATLAVSTPDTGVVLRGTTAPVVLPANGSGVTKGDASGFAGLNVLEGTLCLESQNSASVQAQVWAVVGGNYMNEEEAVLHLKGVSLSPQDGDKDWIVGNFIPEGAATHPTLLVSDGAYFMPGYLDLGRHNARLTPYYPTLAITNATVEARWGMRIGPDRWYEGANIYPTVRIGAGGKLTQRNEVNAKFTVGYNVDVLVSGGSIEVPGMLQLGFPNGVGAENNNYSGTLKFTDGGKLKLSRIVSGTTLADKSKKTEFIFDNGKLVFFSDNSSNVSAVTDATNVTVRIVDGGVEITVPDGVTHIMKIPFVGSGDIVKKGTGTLKFTDASQEAKSIAGFSGAIQIDEGAVELDGCSAIANIKAASGATSATVPTYTDVTFADKVFVDFSGVAAKKGDRIPLAAYTGVLPRLKGVGLGDGLIAAFEVDNGVIYAEISSKRGTYILFR